MMVELWTRKREIRDDDEDDIEDTSGYDKSGVRLDWLGGEDHVLVLVPAGSGLTPAAAGMVNCFRTRNSLKSQFLMMISRISSDLSLSCAQLYHHLRTPS